MLNVTKNDTPTYLAEKCLSMGGIQKTRLLINNLAKVIEENISLEVHKLLENIKKERVRIIQEKSMLEKEKKQKEQERMRPFDLSTERRNVEKQNKPKIIGRLSVLVGANKTGEIVVRDGDIPEALAQNFISTYSLKPHTCPTIVEALKKLIASYKCEKQQFDREKSPDECLGEVHASPLPHSSRQEKSGWNSNTSSISASSMTNRPLNSGRSSQKFLFKVNFVLVDGRKASINVKDKDNLYRLAHNFVVTHKLKEEMTGKIWESLQESYKV